MIKTIIVDDEENAILLLEMQLKKHCPQIEIIAVAQRVKEAIRLIELHQPQLVFLDVELVGGTGFDLLEKIQQQNFHVVFVTAHPGYAIKAFRFSVTDFLLKPVDKEILIQAVKKVDKLISSESTADNKADGLEMRTLRIPFRNGAVFVYFKDIIRMEAEGHYTTIYLSNGKHHVSSHAIKQFEEIIDSELFYRAHRSHLINLKHIKSVNSSAGLLEMTDGARIEVPRRNKEDFLKLLHLRNIDLVSLK